MIAAPVLLSSLMSYRVTLLSSRPVVNCSRQVTFCSFRCLKHLGFSSLLRCHNKCCRMSKTIPDAFGFAISLNAVKAMSLLQYVLSQVGKYVDSSPIILQCRLSCYAQDALHYLVVMNAHNKCSWSLIIWLL